MYRRNVPALAAAAIAAGLTNGQQSRWQQNQVSATMCTWKGLRAAQLNDTAYLDGGSLSWVPGFADGSSGPVVQDDNPQGFIYTLNFSIPFDSSTNISRILNTITKPANNLAPNYYDGALLANDYEFFLYGGLLIRTAAYSPPDGDEVLAYRVADYGVVKDGFRVGPEQVKLPDGVTRYVTYGGAANAPSENKAWYFGGSRSPSAGQIYQVGGGDNFNPTNVSDTLITLDLSKSQSEKWFNDTLPDFIPSRANPSVVWVPVGEQGILVVLGGVAYPSYSTDDAVSLNEAQSEKVSPGYMSNVDIYDIASKKWYQQPTIEAPPQLALGCAVVASAQDFSSYNIYYYGGFDGLHEQEDFSDAVWVLSLPSFVWKKVSSGTTEHARAGHQCLTPYPDQMFTIGGYRASKGIAKSCLDGGILQVFNLTEGKWLSSYDPSVWNEYGVPEILHSAIGGSYSGGATVTTPTPTGWATPALASVFATKYATSKITHHYPYASQPPTNGTRGPLKTGGGGTPSWIAPVLGVVLGLVFVTAVVVAIVLYRKRHVLSVKREGSDNSGDEHHHRIRNWVNNIGGKAVTVSTERTPSRLDDIESRNDTSTHPAGSTAQSPSPEMVQHEMPANQMYELHDTSPTAYGPPMPGIAQAAELGDNPLTHDDVLTRYSHAYSPNSPHTRSPHSIMQSSSVFTGSVSQEQPSSLSSSQIGILPGPGTGAAVAGRGDSPLLGNFNPARTPPPKRSTIVSELSEHRMSHLRNLSGGTVSSTSNAATSLPGTPPPMHTGFNDRSVSPQLVGSPTPLDDAADAAGDYMSARHGFGGGTHAGLSRGPGTSGSLRLSVFRENTDDLGDAPKQSHTQ
ncbi:hypothetical protein F5Y14DRAFT_199263 [Nemania sp. NC0429]|nr:hypothetical protein F5Y14DRAFT_199263 [Nemania sp. NC0429]